MNNIIITQDPTFRGYSRRNIYNMVLFYDTYSSSLFDDYKDRYKLNDIVQPVVGQISNTIIVQPLAAQIENTEIVQTVSGQLSEIEFVQFETGQIVQFQTAQFPQLLKFNNINQLLGGYYGKTN